MSAKVSYRDMVAKLLPLALVGAGEDPDALYLCQCADEALSSPKDRQRIRQQAAYLANPEPAKQRAKERRDSNGDQTAQQRQQRYRERIAYSRLKAREYAAVRKDSGKAQAYRDDHRSAARSYSKARSESAGVNYARELLAKGSPLSAHDIPLELAEVKSIEIKLKRAIRNEQRC
jgi:hypothetical protein